MSRLQSNDRRYQPLSSSHPPQSSPTYSGAYGRDGPQASRVVHPLNPTYSPVSPSSHPNASPRPRIDTRSHSPIQYRDGGGGGRVGVGGGMPYVTSPSRSDPSPPPPSYTSSDGGHAPFALAPPIKAAFAEPPRSPSQTSLAGPPSPYVQVKGDRQGAPGGGAIMWDSDVREKVANEFRGDEERPEFWKRMSGDARRRQSTAWLSKQTGKNGKWKMFAWIGALLVLGIVGGSLAYHFVKNPSAPKEGANAPAALSWANGATDVPTMFTNPAPAAATMSSPATDTSGMKKRSDQKNKKKRHFGIRPTPMAH